MEGKLMNKYILLYVSLSSIISGLLILATVKTAKSNNQYKTVLLRTIKGGLFTVIAYSVFILTDNYYASLCLMEIYFICTIWLARGMMLFVIEYTNRKIAKWKNVLCTLLAVLDTISLLINTYTLHSFDVEKNCEMSIHYWGANFSWPHYLHLGFCYIMVFATFVMLLVSTIKNSEVYRKKYSGILYAYVVVIVTNFLCYTFNTPIDVSVILYGVLATVICYCTMYSFPRQLVSDTLQKINVALWDGLVIFDMDRKCVFLNGKARELFDEKTAEEYISSPSLKESQTRVHNDRSYQIFCHTVDFDKYLTGIFLEIKDNTDELKRYDREKYIATHDAMMDIYNREGFFEAANDLLSKNTDIEMVMLCSNIKDFKLINELFGESVGDQVLKKQADIIKRLSHAENVYGRINDDKFALLMRKEYFRPEQFLDSVDEMRSLAQNGTYKLHVHIGIYEFKGKTESAELMYDKAKLAIESIAQDYQKVFAFYEPYMMDKIVEEKKILSEFDFALADKQFNVKYQSIIDISGRFLGAEALVRWNHPVNGELVSEKFVPQLEKAGQISKLDIYVWDQAARVAADWAMKGHEEYFVAVNISVKDLYYIDVSKTLMGIVEKYDIDPKQLKIEIQEEMLMQDFDKTTTILRKLKERGFDIAIDNFGSGYSSLNMLKDIDTDYIKIDKVFAKESETNDNTKVILESVMSMAKQIGLRAIVDGIETSAQAEVMKKIGCDGFQGYLFEEAVTKEALEKKYDTFFH